MTRTKPETSLVKSCLTYLHAKGVMAWRNNSGGIVKEKRFIRFGEVGSPDILGCLGYTGRLLAIECKVGRNKLSEAQESWLARAEQRGALVIVARSVDDLVAHFGE